MAMNSTPSASPASNTGMMCGSSTAAADRDSLMKRCLKASSAASAGERILSATCRPSRSSWARKTTAMPPRPICSSRRYPAICDPTEKPTREPTAPVAPRPSSPIGSPRPAGPLLPSSDIGPGGVRADSTTAGGRHEERRIDKVRHGHPLQVNHPPTQGPARIIVVAGRLSKLARPEQWRHNCPALGKALRIAIKRTLSAPIRRQKRRYPQAVPAGTVGPDARLRLYGLLDRGDRRPVGQDGKADRSCPGIRVDGPPPAACRVAATLQARQVRGVHAAAGVYELDLEPGVAEPADQSARGVGSLDVLHVKAAAVDFPAEVGPGGLAVERAALGGRIGGGRVNRRHRAQQSRDGRADQNEAFRRAPERGGEIPDS